MRQILIEIKRAITGKPFVLALAGMVVCLCIGAFPNVISVLQNPDMVLMLGYHEDLLIAALKSGIVLFAVPILAAVPYTTAFTEDVRSGYLKPYLTRTSVNRYILGKGLATCVSGGLVLALGMVVTFVLFALVFSPLEVYGQFAVASRLPELGLHLLLYFLSGALWASVGLMCSSFTLNLYLGYAAPFILYYVMIILQERYFRTVFMLNPQNYLTMQGAWPLEGKSAALMLLALVLVLQLLFFSFAHRELRDDKRKKNVLALFVRPIRIPENAYKPKRESALLRNLRQVMAAALYNFKMWRGNMRIVLTFALAFILCFLLSDKAASFAYNMNTTMQAFEPFVWTFGDANSILLISLLLVLLFVDLPFLGAGVPYYLVRMKRGTWAWGQLVYIVAATLLYMVFIFAVTTIICMQNSFIGNMWSETAAILGYSGAGKAVALPALVKTLELSRPFQCAGTIFVLMLLYTLVLSLIMLLFKLLKGKSAGIIAAFGFSLFGLLLNPQLFKQLLQLPDDLTYKANVLVGWLSPLNQATYHMHNFGYDLLPRMWQTYLIFGVLIVLLFIGIRLAAKRYGFNFTGTENGL